MILAFLVPSALAAGQPVDTPSGGTVTLTIQANFAGFTRCQVVGAGIFNGPNAAELASGNFDSWGQAGPATSGDPLVGADRGAGLWGVGTNVDVFCNVVSGAPLVDVDLSASDANAIASMNPNEVATAGPASGLSPFTLNADGVETQTMTVGIELASTDPSGTQGDVVFTFTTP